jgi:hypothetical protein
MALLTAAVSWLTGSQPSCFQRILPLAEVSTNPRLVLDAVTIGYAAHLLQRLRVAERPAKAGQVANHQVRLAWPERQRAGGQFWQLDHVARRQAADIASEPTLASFGWLGVRLETSCHGLPGLGDAGVRHRRQVELPVPGGGSR